jgi:colanic acid biosynthesis protein WcaH
MTPQRLPRDIFATIVRHTPLVSIDLLVRDPQRRLLVGWRTNRPAQNTYFVPGGIVRKGERLADAFERLTEVELGVRMPIARATFVGAYEHLYTDNALGEADFGTHYVVLAHELQADAGDLALPPDQHSRYLWGTDAELLSRDDVHENTKAYCRG